MSTAYHPQQKTVRTRVLSGGGWLEGTFHLSLKHQLAEYLSHHAWYPLTDVVMARARDGALPFLALSAAETLLVVNPEPPATVVGPELKAHEATLLLRDGVVSATFRVPAGLRLSDAVDRTTSFLPVEQAHVRVWTDAQPAHFERLLVNPKALVGVTEPEGHG